MNEAVAHLFVYAVIILVGLFHEILACSTLYISRDCTLCISKYTNFKNRVEKYSWDL